MKMKKYGRTDYIPRPNVSGVDHPNYSHGMARTRPYKTWVSMLNRCRNPNSEHYHNYGGRGISVCDRWQSFENFYADMWPTRFAGGSLERIDNDGNYEPDNCRWATASEQGRNRRTNVFYSLDGKTKCLKDWATDTGVKYTTLHKLVRAKHMPLAEAITRAQSFRC
jgi:hypothetical protein